MRLFARVFLLSALAIYVIVIGVQLVPSKGSGGVVETSFEKGREAVSSIKQFFFHDEELVTLNGPGDVEVPLPITVNVVPGDNRFTGEPVKAPSKSKPTSSGTATTQQKNWFENVISYIPFVPQAAPTVTTPPPAQAAPSVLCTSAIEGTTIVWTAAATNGSEMLYSWNGSAYDGSYVHRDTFTTGGTKTANLAVRNRAGVVTQVTCSREVTVAQALPTDPVVPPVVPPTTPQALSASCYGTTNGASITWHALPLGGTPSYTYSWSTDASGTAQDVSTTYTVGGTKNASLVVRDSVGTAVAASCSASATVVVTPPVTNMTCHLDWCGPAVIRPDYKWDNLTTCVPTWTTDEIAQYAKMVWYGQGGNELPTTNGLSYESTTCWGTLSLAKQRTYNDEVHAKAIALGKRVYIANAFRWDIIEHSVMAQPGFNAAWLVRPATPHQAYVDFYANDTSPVCGGAAKTCRLSYSRGVNQEGRDDGRRLRDMIDASGGAGAYQNAVYYVARPGTGDTVGWAVAALADQRNAAYRAWRITQARQIVQDGHFDFIMLNHKIHFYKAENNWTTPAQPWLGGPWAPNVTELQAGDDTPFSNPPLNYGYTEYIQGWNAIGKDLKAAGVPYMVQTNGGPWVNPSNYNDPSTPNIDEGALVRETLEGAGMLEVDYQSWLSASARTQLDQKVRDLEALGIVIVKINSGCGYGNGTPTSCTTASAPFNTFGSTQLAQSSTQNINYIFLARVFILFVIVALIVREKTRYTEVHS